MKSMRNLFYLIIPALLLISCSVANPNAPENHVRMSTNPTKAIAPPVIESPVANDESKEAESAIVGGWVPVFFSWMDNKQLAGITEGMNDGKIRRVMISYPPKMQTLAGKIRDSLQGQTKQDVEMQSIELKDTDQVSYNLTQVIVTLYFR